MARAEIPTVVLDPATGNAVVGASCLVKIRTSGAPATVFLAETGATTVTNPRVSDAYGRVAGWVERGSYQLDISGTGLVDFTEYWESSPAGDGAIDTNWIASGAVTSAKILDGTITSAKILDGTITNAKLATPSGKLVQMVSTQTGAVATGTTAIAVDDTIPQITEGDQYMTLGITPNNASNILFIQVVAFASASALLRLSVALFVGSTANALAATSLTTRTGGEPVGQALNHQMVAGGTSALTFRVRIGNHADGYTTTFNGQDSARLFGGVAASSITITEFTP